ncbi:thiol:disulfide interchange protein TlpA [Methylocapsa acidiphila]|uniref:thiol:disulfide interchange protein TlpA n=1 Tax=Methylocapsa acidiphila TaxID=133552 RepID=UPI00047A5F5E|nr:TlpA disulfide reductase family protein [Methylocapsa acidiphila]
MTQQVSKQEKRPGLPRGLSVAAGLVAAAVVVVGVLYAIKPPSGKVAESDPACQESAAKAARLQPLARGELAALSLAKASRPVPALAFKGSDGARVSLADFKGRDLILNLWATWCVPCRQEMPALDRLQGALGSKDFQVVAVNIDTAKLERPKAFLNEIGVKNLAFYADETADIFQTLKQAGKILGLPTTILIGKDGCEIGTLAGPAQWDSPEALALLKALQG